MNVERASIDDVEGIRDLIGIHAKQNKMLSRSLSYLYENLREYSVVKKGKKVIGCCALHISWRDLGEVKSLAVHPKYSGKGIGKTLLKSAIKEAEQFGIPKVFTLTLEPEFFIKHGFKKIQKNKLPMKIWGECIQCPKYPDCDETALEYRIK
ncbi:MAG: N-acetyltransferase [Candidatus Altiarchaeota archaeon]